MAKRNNRNKIKQQSSSSDKIVYNQSTIKTNDEPNSNNLELNEFVMDNHHLQNSELLDDTPYEKIIDINDTTKLNEFLEIKEDIKHFSLSLADNNISLRRQFFDFMKFETFNFLYRVQSNKNMYFDIYSKNNGILQRGNNSYTDHRNSRNSLKSNNQNNSNSSNNNNNEFLKFIKRKPLVAIISLLIIFISILGFTHKNAYNVYVDNNLVGIIKKESLSQDELTKSIIDASVAKIESELDTGISINETISLSSVNVSEKEINSLDYILNNVSKSLTYKIEGASININGESKAIVVSKKVADNILNKILETYKGDNTNIISAEFVEAVEVKPVFVEEDELTSEDGCYKLLTSTENKEQKYTIQSGDTLFGIALKNDLSLNNLLKINPSINEKTILRIGQQIDLVLPTPLLSVKTVESITFTDVAKKPTNTVKNDKEYKTYRKVIKAGSDGEKIVTANVTKINGVEQSRENVSEKITIQPTPETVEVGTLSTPPKKAIGSFIFPVSGQLSSNYGARWNKSHKGIDISAPKGTAVKASDGGKVIFAGWSGDYGNLVKIDHGNGFITAYAHNSKIAVSVGDRVAQGTVISYVGSTGRSTGNHLHFEVILNGVNKNPLNYVK